MQFLSRKELALRNQNIMAGLYQPNNANLQDAVQRVTMQQAVVNQEAAKLIQQNHRELVSNGAEVKELSIVHAEVPDGVVSTVTTTYITRNNRSIGQEVPIEVKVQPITSKDGRIQAVRFNATQVNQRTAVLPATVYGVVDSDMWACTACTFENSALLPHCEACFTPKGKTVQAKPVQAVQAKIIQSTKPTIQQSESKVDTQLVEKARSFYRSVDNTNAEYYTTRTVKVVEPNGSFALYRETKYAKDGSSSINGTFIVPPAFANADINDKIAASCNFSGCSLIALWHHNILNMIPRGIVSPWDLYAQLKGAEMFSVPDGQMAIDDSLKNFAEFLNCRIDVIVEGNNEQVGGIQYVNKNSVGGVMELPFNPNTSHYRSGTEFPAELMNAINEIARLE
jgi:hypothetical protein